jgi:hypothetical protein
MLPPAPRAPPAAVPIAPQQQQQQAQQQQGGSGSVPPWRQMPGDVAASGITTAASDREIPWAELQFGHQIGEGGFGKVGPLTLTCSWLLVQLVLRCSCTCHMHPVELSTM